jgi:hypothetical protein
MLIRYHLDESVANAVAHGLRYRGVDVTTAKDVGLIGATDVQHIAFALPEVRVVVSHDSDFLRLDHEGVAHAGIAYCAPRQRTVGQIVNRLTDLWRTRTAEEMSGKLEFL